METGGCPHTAIREDASINQEAVQRLSAKFPDLDIIFVESGGDNLAASFSPELVDSSIYVIDVSGATKFPGREAPGMTRSDLLVINKTDLAPHVGASLEVMDRDAKRMRGERPYLFTNLKQGQGIDAVIEWIKRDGPLYHRLKIFKGSERRGILRRKFEKRDHRTVLSESFEDAHAGLSSFLS